MTNFEEFYAAYPNKQAKSRCEGYYKKISDEEHQKIMLALDAHKRWRREMEKAGQFVPVWCNAATWIFQKRYKDELPISHAELKEKQKAKLCHCGKDLPCPTHFYENLRDDWRWEMMRNECKENGLHKLTPRESLDLIKRKLVELVVK